MRRFGMPVLAALLLAGTATGATAQNPPRYICTAGSGGGYWTAGNDFKAAIERYVPNLSVLETGGSEDNLDGVAGSLPNQPGKRCDFFIFQRDAQVVKAQDIARLKSQYREIRDLYPEVVHLVLDEKAGYASLDDVAKKNAKVAVVAGSGANTTLNAIKKLTPDPYGKVGVTLVPDWDQAFDLLKDGKVAGLFYVGGLSSNPESFMNKKINGYTAKKLFLGHIENANLEGTEYYAPARIDNDMYSNLQGWRNTRTIQVDAVVAMSAEMEQTLNAAGTLRQVTRAISDAVETIRANQRLDMLIAP